MDYLLLPDGATHMSIPDLGGSDFTDEEGVKGYDVRQGWKLNHILSGDFSKARDNWDIITHLPSPSASADWDDIPTSSVHESEALQTAYRFQIAKFLQTWLFFGLLRDALGRTIYRKDYSRLKILDDGSSKSYVTAKTLMSDLETRFHTAKEDQTWIIHLQTALREAHLVLELLSNEACFRLQLSGNILWSIRCLYQTIDMLGSSELKWAFQPKDGVLVVNDFSSPSLSAHQSIRGYLGDKFGWCYALLLSVHYKTGDHGLYYLSRMNREITREQNLHILCTRINCVAFNVDDRTYKTRHTSACGTSVSSNCVSSTWQQTNVDVLRKEVLDALENDTIPLISVTDVGGEARIGVTRYQEGVHYTAISHVWSDGLGNTLVNSLPSCQLLDLHKKVSHLAHKNGSETSFFWIDTLCIPLIPAESRKSAIRKLAQTFSKAEAVLVISSEMGTINKPSSNEEIFLRVWCSKWMTRLWTLNEALHASAIWIQFSDCSVNFTTLLQQASQDKAYSLQYRASRFQFDTMRWSEDIDKTFLATWAATMMRSTSKARDEVICLLQIMGQPTTAVLNAKEGREIHSFWDSFNVLPRDILWYNGPRLQEPGYRWAPRSLLAASGASGTISQFRLSVPAQRTSQGLVVSKLQGFWFGQLAPPSRYPLQFTTPSAPMVFVLTCVGPDHRATNWNTNRQLHKSWTGGIALILQWVPGPKDPERLGILLANCRKNGKGMFGDWLAFVHVFERNSEACQRFFAQEGTVSSGSPTLSKFLPKALVEKAGNLLGWESKRQPLDMGKCDLSVKFLSNVEWTIS